MVSRGELEEKVENLQRKVEQQEQKLSQFERANNTADPSRDMDNTSRRDFLKKIGALSVAGLGASLFAKNAAAFQVRSENPFTVGDTSGNINIEIDTDGTLEMNENALKNIGEATLANTQTQPTSNGEFRRDGTNVYVQTGGETKNLSNIGTEDDENETVSTFDIYVYQQGENNYNAVDENGSELTSGSNGMTVLQNGIDAAPDNGRIYVEGNYTYDNSADQLTLGDGKHLIGPNATFDHQVTVGGGSSALLVLAAGSVGSSSNLTADADRGDNWVAVNDTGLFAVGDVVRVINDAPYGTATSNIEGELHQVWDIDSGRVFFNEPLELSHGTADNAELQLINTDEGHVEGITINGSDIESASWGITASYALNSSVENVTIRDIGEKCVNFETSYDCSMTNCYVERSDVQGDGYGVRVRNACANTRIEENVFHQCRHAVAHSQSTSTGLPRTTWVRDNIMTGTRKGSLIDAHEGVISMFVEGNLLFPNDKAAVQGGCRELSIRNNTSISIFDDIEQEGGFFITRSGHDWVNGTFEATGNSIYGIRNRSAFRIHPQNEPWMNVTIKDNYFHRPEDRIVRLRDSVDNFVFSGNVIDCEDQGEVAFNALSVGFSSNPPDIGKVTIHNNEFIGLSDQSIWIGDSTQINSLEFVSIAGNYFTETPYDSGDPVIDIGMGDDGVIASNIFAIADSNVGDVIELGSNVSNMLVKDNAAFHNGTSFLNDSADGTVTDGNYENTGTGWSPV